jgi:hypothetical protein
VKGALINNLLWVAYGLPFPGQSTTMKKFFVTLTAEHVSPAGLLFSFLLGVFAALLYFAICL